LLSATYPFVRWREEKFKKAAGGQTRLKLVLDRFDMVIKNEECLSCHVIIMKSCMEGECEGMISIPFRKFPGDFASDPTENLTGFGQCCPAAAESVAFGWMSARIEGCGRLTEGSWQ
jgi:hypothetical protein